MENSATKPLKLSLLLTRIPVRVSRRHRQGETTHERNSMGQTTEQVEHVLFMFAPISKDPIKITKEIQKASSQVYMSQLFMSLGKRSLGENFIPEDLKSPGKNNENSFAWLSPLVLLLLTSIAVYYRIDTTKEETDFPNLACQNLQSTFPTPNYLFQPQKFRSQFTTRCTFRNE